MTYDNIHNQQPDVDYTEEYRTIAATFIRRELGLLIGSGMSTADAPGVGIPTGSEMAKLMLRRAVMGDEDASNELLDKLAEKYPFEAIADFLVKKHPYHDFAAWLTENGGLADATPLPSHAKLAQLYELSPNSFPRRIFTTNFDTLLEDSLGEEIAIGITSENPGDLVLAKKKDLVAVVHLHGSIKYPKSLVYGERELTTTEGPLFDLFRASLATEIFVLVGYSLTDTNLRRVFFDVQRVVRVRSGLGKRTFAVSPADGNPATPNTAAGVARAIWGLRDTEHLPISAAQFFEKVFEAIDTFVLVDLRRRVAKALGKDEHTLLKMLETAAKPFGVIKPDDLLVYLSYIVPRLGEGK